MFDEIRTRLPKTPPDGSDNPLMFSDYIQKAWVDDQIKYHKDKAEECNHTYHRLELLCECIFYLAFASALAHLLTHSLHNHVLDHGLTLAALVLPALAATLEGIRSIREYKRLAIRSQQMERRLTDLKKQFNLMTPEKFENILAQMEQLMLDETEDWLSFMTPAELYKVA